MVDEAALDTTVTGSDLAAGTVTGTLGTTSAAETDATNQLNATGGVGALTYALVSGGNAATAGTYGTIQVNANGTYVYTLTKPFDTTPDDNNGAKIEGAESFTYKATDANGNTTTGTITVNIVDDVPTASTNGTVQLDDDTMPNGNPNGTGDDPNSVNATGTLAHSYGADEPGTTLLTGAGLPNSSAVEGAFIQTVNGTGTLLTISQIQNGAAVAVVQVSLSNQTGGAYTVTQLHAIDHEAGQNENNQPFTVNYAVKDGDGDTASGTLAINVDDDTPVAVSDFAVVSESATARSNVVLVIDTSGSMASDGDPNTPGTQSRIDLLKAAVQNLFNTGNVNAVNIYEFNSGATHHGGPVNGWYTNLTDAMAAINLLTAGGGTDYDAALASVTSTYTAPPGGGNKTIAIFMSDGQPTEDNGTGSVGIDHNGAGGEEAAWMNFLASHNFDASYAVGFGGLSPADVGFLEPIAWKPGETYSTYDVAGDPNVIVVTPTSLTGVLQGTVASTATGNVITNGSTGDSFGADGGRILSIQINGVTYVWDGGSVIDPSNSAINLSGSKLTDITTPGGGKLTFDFATGAWSYDAPANVDHDLQESFQYVITDGDGDTANATLGVLVKDVNDPLVINGAVTGIVEEEHGLPGGIEDTTAQNGLDTDGSSPQVTNAVSGNFATLISSGIDGTLSFAFAPMAGNPAVQTVANGALLSGGKPVLFGMESGNLIGYVNSDGGTGPFGGGDTKVFTVTLNGATGAYSFTLNAPVDHPINSVEDAIAISLNGRVTVTDSAVPGRHQRTP